MRDIIRSGSCDTVEELHLVLDEVETLTTQFGYYAAPHEGFYYVMTEEDWETGGDPMQSEEAQEIGKREIKTALADLECRTKTNYNDTRLTIQFKLEEQFVKENKKELDEFKAAQEQAAKG